jgi:hypothetical protein
MKNQHKTASIHAYVQLFQGHNLKVTQCEALGSPCTHDTFESWIRGREIPLRNFL